MEMRKEWKQYTAQRNNEPREINFIKYIGIVLKSIHGRCNAVSIVRPYDDSRQIKQQGGNTVGRYFCHPVKNDKIYESGEQGLQENPDRSQDRLLVTGNNIPPDETEQQIFILKKFTAG